MTWHLERMAAFDLETTGVNTETARIVEAYLGLVGGGMDPKDYGPVLINPGVEVPAEAARIHGYTTEHVRENGEKPEPTIDAITDTLAHCLATGVPLVGHNISYDLTVLDRECRRHGIQTLADRFAGVIGPVIDTYVLSKLLDPYRRRVSPGQGAHQLKTCAQVFHVGWSDDDAHGARYDALAAARVAWRMGVLAHLPKEERPKMTGGRELFDRLAVPLDELHALQVEAKAKQDASYAEHRRSRGESVDGLDGHWPYTPLAVAVGT